MKKIKDIVRQGVSLKVLNYVMLAMAIIISIILSIAMSQTTKIYDETHSSTQNIFSVRKGTYELQQASDYLTEQIRFFVTSGDKKVEAEKVVFGKEYQNKKDLISDHMQTCLSELEIQMETEQANVAESLKKQVVGEHIQKCVEKIRDEEDIPVKDAYGIRFLAKTYNLMHHTNLKKKVTPSYNYYQQGNRSLVSPPANYLFTNIYT